MAKQWERLGCYLARAMRLRCPLCGVSPLFLPVREVRSLADWFATRNGCGPCGYPYEREPGYFLLATWGINYFAAAFVGLAMFFLGRVVLDLDTPGILLLTLPPVAVVALASVRHAKALFLAVDRFLDPQD